MAPIEPDLHAIAVEESRFTAAVGGRLQFALIGSDDYAVRDQDHPEKEIRRPGDDFRKLGATLGRGSGAGQADTDLYTIGVDPKELEQVEGTGLEAAQIGGLDAYAVRDPEHLDVVIRATGDAWRKLGATI